MITKESVKYVPVYNFEVAVDNSYCLPLIAVHNCQAFSVAGQRKGFEDARGTLFFEIARIASAKRPCLMLLENVKGLLSHDSGQTFETMCAILSDIGYAIDFRVVNSKYFGVPQNRERIFIVASRDAYEREWIIEGNGVVAKTKRRVQTLGIRTFNFDWPTNAAVTTRLRDILESNVEERYYLSEEKTAKLIAQLGERADSDECEMIGHVDGINGHDICRRVYSPTGVAPTGSSGNTTPKIAVENVGNVNPSGIGMNCSVYADSGLSPTLTTNKGEGPKVLTPFTVVQKTHGASITVKFDETRTLQAARLDKVPQVVTEEVRAVLTPDRPEKRQNGRRFKEDGEEAFTLTAQDKHGIAIGKYPRYRIRKLTPLECWRLQGFTDEQHTLARDAGISDSQRYKQAGNAVTTNVINAIGRRLVPLLGEPKRLIPLLGVSESQSNKTEVSALSADRREHA
ncbi:DNA (cytosine-5-)-methyltransferase [Paenibacillus sp. SI8]|uniref:DNA (cytosine-5-)-methyltransferase n=1 Tax=unclassified Paenibacillus TaxID=185978 RepID=UPI003465A1FC